MVFPCAEVKMSFCLSEVLALIPWVEKNIGPGLEISASAEY
jgi:hypothetical protein